MNHIVTARKIYHCPLSNVFSWGGDGGLIYIYFKGGSCGAVAEIKVFEQCERWFVRKPSNECSGIPAITFPSTP